MRLHSSPEDVQPCPVPRTPSLSHCRFVCASGTHRSERPHLALCLHPACWQVFAILVMHLVHYFSGNHRDVLSGRIWRFGLDLIEDLARVFEHELSEKFFLPKVLPFLVLLTAEVVSHGFIVKIDEGVARDGLVENRCVVLSAIGLDVGEGTGGVRNFRHLLAPFGLSYGRRMP